MTPPQGDDSLWMTISSPGSDEPTFVFSPGPGQPLVGVLTGEGFTRLHVETSGGRRRIVLHRNRRRGAGSRAADRRVGIRVMCAGAVASLKCYDGAMRALVIGIVIAMTLGVAACGSDDSSDDDTATEDTGAVGVPDVVGDSVEDATATLEAAGFTLRVVQT